MTQKFWYVSVVLSISRYKTLNIRIYSVICTFIATIVQEHRIDQNRSVNTITVFDI